MYPNAFLFSLNQILSLKGYWAHTPRVIHPVVVEVATRIHNEHVSITAVKVTWRQKVLHLSRLTKPIVPHLTSIIYLFLPTPPIKEVKTMLREIDKLVNTDAFNIL